MTGISATGLTWSAAYNGDGARRKQTVNGTVTTYTLDLAAPLVTVLTEKQAASANNKTYLYGLGDSPLAVYTGTWRYLSGRDGLGSVRQETDADGNVLTTRSFDPYGVVMQGDGGSPFGYTGEVWDNATSLVFLRARYLNPALGMFLAEDIKPVNVMRPSDGGMYLYVNGNPINYTDPSGWCVFCDSGRVKVDARPDNATFIYARPDATSARVISVPDEERVRILPEPMQNDWRKVTFLGQVGWIENRKLLDNCDGPPGTFGCLPVARWDSQANWNWGFGPSEFAHRKCEAGLDTKDCKGTYSELRGLHNGLDFVADSGSSLVWLGTGNGLVLDNPYPIDAADNIVIEFGTRRVLFGHISDSYVSPGDQVRPGQTIGASGSSNGDHLHFGVRSGTSIHYNPLYYFTPPLQDIIVSHMADFYGGFNAYSMISFDAEAQVPDDKENFWVKCPDYTGIVFRVLHN